MASHPQPWYQPPPPPSIRICICSYLKFCRPFFRAQAMALACSQTRVQFVTHQRALYFSAHTRLAPANCAPCNAPHFRCRLRCAKITISKWKVATWASTCLSPCRCPTSPSPALSSPCSVTCSSTKNTGIQVRCMRFAVPCRACPRVACCIPFVC